MKAWKKSVTGKAPTKEQAKKLTNLAARVESLWAITLSKMRIAEDQIRRDIDIWGRETEHTAKNVRREQIEQELLHDAEGAYLRLCLAMDAWNALTFWPLTATDQLPDLDEWLAALTDILGTEVTARDAAQGQLGRADSWDELVQLERTEIELSGARKIETVLEKHPWLNTVRTVAAEQGFFHWDLDFAAVFARSGFDLQVGNPPWVRPDVKIDDLYAELDPWFALAHKPTQAVKKERRERLNTDPRIRDLVFAGAGETVATAAVLGNIADYPLLKDQRPDLYRAFLDRAWKNMGPGASVALIHPKSHLTEKQATVLRRAAYHRLRRNWHFSNKLGLFDIGTDEKNFDVSVYGGFREAVRFLHCGGAHHPQTIALSLGHNGHGPVPAFKTDEGEWDLRPHKDRVQIVDATVLSVWHAILEDDDIPLDETRTIHIVNSEATLVLQKLAGAQRIGVKNLKFSGGWNETTARKQGYFEAGWEQPSNWADVILQGTHIGVSTPMIKQPNSSMKSGKDWSSVDIETMPPSFIPATTYQPTRDSKPTYDQDYPKWEINGIQRSPRESFRVAWRQMAAPTGFRTLYPALIVPGAAHVNGVVSLGAGDAGVGSIAVVGASMSSLLSDFLVRSVGSHLWPGLIQRLPYPARGFDRLLSKRYLRLNCLTEAYAPLWEEVVGEPWGVDTPLRRDEERRTAQVEIDAIVALSLGVTADELCMIYRTQFPVMRRYDQEDRFDANGRKVPKEIVKADAKLKDGAELSVADRTWVHPQSDVEYVYEYPFRQLDREADMREAYARFEET